MYFTRMYFISKKTIHGALGPPPFNCVLTVVPPCLSYINCRELLAQEEILMTKKSSLSFLPLVQDFSECPSRLLCDSVRVSCIFLVLCIPWKDNYTFCKGWTRLTWTDQRPRVFSTWVMTKNLEAAEPVVLEVSWRISTEIVSSYDAVDIDPVTIQYYTVPLYRRTGYNLPS
jgi:hypothetical protein